MKKLLSFVRNEVLKARRSVVFWVVLAVFTGLPLMVGLLREPVSDWEHYLADLLGPVASLLVVGYSFTSAWVFGREYVDGTMKDLLVKPIAKRYSVLSKFIVITLWNELLAVLTFGAILSAGAILGIDGATVSLIFETWLSFLSTALMIMAVCMTSALLANVTRGYLAPIGFAFVVVIASNIVVQLGLGPYFPWTIPVLWLTESSIGTVSLIIVAAAGIVGFAGTVAWWRYAEHR